VFWFSPRETKALSLGEFCYHDHELGIIKKKTHVFRAFFEVRHIFRAGKTGQRQQLVLTIKVEPSFRYLPARFESRGAPHDRLDQSIF
jgi:hypothetical protein